MGGWNKRHNEAPNYKTGKKATQEYRAWVSMFERCRPDHRAARYYAEKGVLIDKQWDVYENFLTAVGRAPSPAHSLDRWPDPNGNYEPGNVRWATAAEQAVNRRNNRVLVVQGESHVLSEWARQTGINNQTIGERLKRGWGAERAVLTQVQQKGFCRRGHPQEPNRPCSICRQRWQQEHRRLPGVLARETAYFAEYNAVRRIRRRIAKLLDAAEGHHVR